MQLAKISSQNAAIMSFALIMYPEKHLRGCEGESELETIGERRRLVERDVYGGFKGYVPRTRVWQPKVGGQIRQYRNLDHSQFRGCPNFTHGQWVSLD